MSTQRGLGLFRQTSHPLDGYIVPSQTQRKVINLERAAAFAETFY